MSEEHVLVLPRASVVPTDGWYGIRETDADVFAQLVTREGRFQPRDEMERNPSFKQVIPYLVLRDGDAYFLMRRTRAGGDERLHEQYSIGVGGHLNPGDGDLRTGLRREWEEEIAAAFVPSFRFVGLLNDDTTDVGSVHLGAVFLADAAGRPVTIRETSKLVGGFAAPEAVAAVADRMESWSRIAFEHLEGQPVAPGDG